MSFEKSCVQGREVESTRVARDGAVFVGLGCIEVRGCFVRIYQARCPRPGRPRYLGREAARERKPRGCLSEERSFAVARTGGYKKDSDVY